MEQSHEFECKIPDPIKGDHFADHLVDSIELVNNAGTTRYSVYVFTPTEEMPEIVAQWLHYRTMTEPVVAAENDGDFTRFRSVEEIMERFLIDKGGRTLYIAVNDIDGSVDGISWLHPLHNDQVDHRLVKAGRKALDDQSVLPHELATIATREYSKAVHAGMSLQLGGLAINKCFAESDAYRGIVGIFGVSDNMTLELVGSGLVPEGTSMRYAEKGPGWVILMAMRSSVDDDVHTKYQY